MKFASNADRGGGIRTIRSEVGTVNIGTRRESGPGKIGWQGRALAYLTEKQMEKWKTSSRPGVATAPGMFPFRILFASELYKRELEEFY